MATQLQVPVCKTAKVESSKHVGGTRYTKLQVRDVEGEEVLLRREFIVGDVTTGLVSLGQLCQAGWKINGEGSGELFLIDPQDQIKVHVYFKNKSFAIRAFVRHVGGREDDGDPDVFFFMRIL